MTYGNLFTWRMSIGSPRQWKSRGWLLERFRLLRKQNLLKKYSLLKKCKYLKKHNLLMNCRQLKNYKLSKNPSQLKKQSKTNGPSRLRNRRKTRSRRRSLLFLTTPTPSLLRLDLKPLPMKGIAKYRRHPHWSKLYRESPRLLKSLWRLSGQRLRSLRRIRSQRRSLLSLTTSEPNCQQQPRKRLLTKRTRRRVLKRRRPLRSLWTRNLCHW